MRMETDNESLARATASGDRAAFAALLARPYDRIHGLCYRLTGQRAEAQDLPQDICAALPAKLAALRAEARFTVTDGPPLNKGRASRILLATEGEFNFGIDNPNDLKTFIARERTNGTYLSVLGFGRGNLDDATMQALAQNGNGTTSHIDTVSEAQKVLADQLTGTLVPIADDVKLQVEWNPRQSQNTA